MVLSRLSHYFVNASLESIEDFNDLDDGGFKITFTYKNIEIDSLAQVIVFNLTTGNSKEYVIPIKILISIYFAFALDGRDLLSSPSCHSAGIYNEGFMDFKGEKNLPNHYYNMFNDLYNSDLIENSYLYNQIGRICEKMVEKIISIINGFK
jgi:hypothetical protein